MPKTIARAMTGSRNERCRSSKKALKASITPSLKLEWSLETTEEIDSEQAVRETKIKIVRSEEHTSELQ